METNLDILNDQQKQAVLESINHNIVLVAAAGSGKTKTLVTRTEYLINEVGVLPSQIMLITFTNKAVNEIKERIAAACPNSQGMWVGTFHNISGRIIRMFGSKLGITRYTMLDESDSKAIIKEIMEESNLNFPITPATISAYRRRISDCKNNLIRPRDIQEKTSEDITFKRVFEAYQTRCWRQKTFDFDDLLVYALMLLSNYEDVLNWFRTNIKYVMADECQDGNQVNLDMLKYIAGENNIMLVGDQNQSIYGFRNAKPSEMTDFAASWPNTKVMKLEQNYRSTQNIIRAANTLIEKNDFGIKTKMFCQNEAGERIHVFEASNENFEAQWVGLEIMDLKRKRIIDYKDVAVIYRTKMQSRLFEKRFTELGIPFSVHGSTAFYQRKDVKDLIAHCKLLQNPNDTASLLRVLKSRAGIGETTIKKIIEIGEADKVPAVAMPGNYVVKGNKTQKKALAVIKDITELYSNSYSSWTSFLDALFFETSYKRDIQLSNKEDAKERLEILDEFYQMFQSMQAESPNMAMDELLMEVSLLSDATGQEKENLNSVKLMTAHGSKGLEFGTVFVVGAEEGLFPHTNSVRSGKPEQVEEERRLFYVSMTRAKKRLYITHCTRRCGNGGLFDAMASRFLKEIPEEYLLKCNL